MYSQKLSVLIFYAAPRDWEYVEYLGSFTVLQMNRDTDY
jgi:hypothetical protein